MSNVLHFAQLRRHENSSSQLIIHFPNLVFTAVSNNLLRVCICRNKKYFKVHLCYLFPAGVDSERH